MNDLVLTGSGLKLRVIVMSGDLKDDVNLEQLLVMAFHFNRIQSPTLQVLHITTFVYLGLVQAACVL